MPVKSAARRLALVLFQPRGVFTELRQRPAWLLPWFLIAAALVGLGLLTLPYADRVIEVELAARGSASMPGWVVPLTRALTVAGAPLYVLLAAVGSALVMWPVLRLLGHRARFRALLCAAIHSHAATVLQAGLTALVLFLRGSPEQAIHGAGDLRVSLGADMLLPHGSHLPLFVRAVLSGIGPLQLWGLVVLAVGVSVLEQPKRGAWIAALASWVALLVFSGLTAGIGS